MNVSATLKAKSIKIDRLKKKLSVYDAGLGENPMPPPNIVLNSISKHAHHKEYTDSKGIPKLQKILNSELLLVGNGLKPLIFNVQLSFQKLYPNGVIVYIIPIWVSYLEQSNILNIKNVKIYPSNNWKITSQDLENTLKNIQVPHLVVFNNPNNPSGCIYTVKEVENFAKIFEKYNSIVFSDSIYSDIVHPKYKFNYGIISNFYRKTIIGTSLSKSYACGGHRFGWLIFQDEELKELYNTCQILASSIYSCPTVFLQYVTVDLLKSDISEYLTFQSNMYQQIREYCYSEFTKLHLKVSECAAAWYFLLDFNYYSNYLQKMYIFNSDDLNEYLANNLGIITVSGSNFGIKKSYVIRYSFVDISDISVENKTYNISNIKKCIQVLDNFLNNTIKK
tara:strand:- start:4112 stop:5290 length:1179 start_codon:yes stop_codon:yes gene_type:complete